MKKNRVVKNAVSPNINQTRNVIEISIDNKIKVSGSAEGAVRFSKPLPITNNKEQLNGSKYDIKSMDISAYKGLVTIDHSDSIKDIVGKVIGLRKEKSKVTIDGINFAVEQSALAWWSMEMLLSGFVTDFSIETIGPWPDDDGIYFDSQLVGLSMVIVGNNKLATVSALSEKVLNSARSKGLSIDGLENYLGLDKNKVILDNEDMKYATIKNTRDFAVTVSYKNVAGDDTKVELKPGETVDVSEDQADDAKSQIDGAKKPAEAPATKPVTAPAPEVKDEALATALEIAMAPITKKLEKMEKTIFDNSAREPEFKKVNAVKVEGELKAMNYRERAGKQINYAWDFLKAGNQEAGKKLNAINEYHMDLLKEEGKVDNVITISDFGNFVISPELLKDIEGHRSNFTSLLSKLEFRETLSLQMAWLKRSGDISMTEVEKCDDDADGNLKPISEYTAEINTANLHELAAVTPVCNAATRFLAVDLIGDVTQGYRNDYDRKRAQLFIVRCQQAVNSTGFKIPYNGTSDVSTLQSWIQTWVKAQEEIMGGTFIFSQKTYGELLLRAIAAGISGPLSGLFTTGDQPMIAGSPYIIVPNELLPALNTSGTKSFTVEGAAVTIDQAVFYVELSTFSGRTSGGLSFDLSTEAAYEVNQTVKSAFQRNELILRGSFFRNGAIRDDAKVSSMYAAGVS